MVESKLLIGVVCQQQGDEKYVNAFFLDALHQYGYPALWLIVFVAAAGAPISGNLLLFAAGAFAAFGDFNIVILFFVGVSAAVLGDNLGYTIGWRFGNPIFVWLERQKRFRFFSSQAFARGRTYFRRRAGWAVFVTRFLIVVLGGPINLLAGAERYAYARFLFWDISGQILGAVIPLGLGYIFAESWSEVESIFGAFSSLVLASLVTIVIVVTLIRRVRARKRSQEAEDIQEDEGTQDQEQEKIHETETVEIAEHEVLQQVLSSTEHNTGPLSVSD